MRSDPVSNDQMAWIGCERCFQWHRPWTTASQQKMKILVLIDFQPDVIFVGFMLHQRQSISGPRWQYQTPTHKEPQQTSKSYNAHNNSSILEACS